MSDDAANKKARELMEYCGGAWWEDGVAAIAAALRARESEIVVAAQHALWEKDAAIKNSLAVKDEIIIEQQAEIAKLKAKLATALGGEVKE